MVYLAPLRCPVSCRLGAVLSGSDSGPVWRGGPVPWACCASYAGRGCRGGDICADHARGPVPVVWLYCRGLRGDSLTMGGAGGRRREDHGPVMGAGPAGGPDAFGRSGDRCGRAWDRLTAGGTVPRGVSPPVLRRSPLPWARLSLALRLRGFLRTAPGSSDISGSFRRLID